MSYFLALAIGIYIGIMLSIFVKKRAIKKYSLGISKTFLQVLGKFDQILFSKRINNYAYFSFEG